MWREKNYNDCECRKHMSSGEEATLEFNCWYISVGNSIEEIDNAVRS